MAVETQIRVDQALRTLGGYWHPLAGLARLLEELGEFAAAIDLEERRCEAADCAVATIALANQYCVEIGRPIEPTLEKSERDALISAGKLSRLINLFEGAKPPKPEEPSSFGIQDVVAEFLQSIADASTLEWKTLLDMAASTAEANAKRDIGRFNLRADAVTAPSREAFWAASASGPLTPATGLWGNFGNIDMQRNQVERFMRVDIVHPLAGLVFGPIKNACALLQTAKHYTTWCGSESRVRTLRAEARQEPLFFVLLDGQTPLSDLRAVPIEGVT